MEIEVLKQKEDDKKWDFEVTVDGVDFSVELDKGYWEKLTKKKVEPGDLVKKSFEFLLNREPKESILKKFNLRVISGYFPEYEEEIKK